MLEFIRTDLNGKYSIFYDSNNYTISNSSRRLMELETEAHLVDYGEDEIEIAMYQNTFDGLIFIDIFDSSKYFKVAVDVDYVNKIIDNCEWWVYEVKADYAEICYKDGEEEKSINAKLGDVPVELIGIGSDNIMESEEITIDEERYNKLVGLMSYEEATEIIGSKGELKRSNKNEDGITLSTYGYLAEEFEVYVSYNSRGISSISKIKSGIN